jgi:hypothetical protein
MFTPASKAALMVAKWQALFSFLHSQTSERTAAMRKTSGRWRSASTSKSRRTTCYIQSWGGFSHPKKDL